MYGWTCSETNLRTLDTAPEGAKKLAEWLTLQGRKSSLVEWLGSVRTIVVFTVGSCTLARVDRTDVTSGSQPSEYPICILWYTKDPVEEIKAKYDGPMRKLWRVPEGKYLVGTDAEGIQLRILAHLMQSKDYVDAIVTGKKEDETDIHNVNRRALGFDHISRDMAKTFIYAFLLGAGTAKIAQILSVTMTEAKQAVDNFLESIDGPQGIKEAANPLHCSQRMVQGFRWTEGCRSIRTQDTRRYAAKR